MRRLWRVVVAYGLVVAAIFGAYILENRRFGAFPESSSALQMRQSFARVALVGDSWVARGGLEEPLTKHLTRLGLKVSVVSYGLGGADTRRIYQEMRIGSEDTNSTASPLFAKGVRYCVILAGVNDAVGHLGAEFYAHHMTAMIALVQRYGIVPVVMEMPDFGIGQVKAGDAFSAIKRAVFRYVFDGGRVDVRKHYREVFRKRLTENRIAGGLVLRSEQLRLDYSVNSALYSDPAHLSEEGYERLAEAIAEAIYTAEASRL